MPPDAKALKDLDTVVQAAVNLIQQLQAALSAIQKNPTVLPAPTSSNDEKPIDAIALARNSASLIRAHSTKLSLVLINEPFTPSAIIQVIRDLTGGPVPTLAASIDACHPHRYTATYRRELTLRCRAVLQELAQLLQSVPRDGKSLAGSEQGFSSEAKGGKGSIALTGVLWAACDETVGLANKGVGGFFVNKIEEWRDTLKDVMGELKEWGEEEPDEEDDEDEDDSDDQAGEADGEQDSAQDMLDDLMNSHRTISRTDPDKIRPRLETSLKRIRLVTILYQAIIKRRIKKLPAIPDDAPSSPPSPADATIKAIPQRLDEVAKLLVQLPDRFGDLACAFYELDKGEIDQIMDRCFLDAFAASEILGRSWEGGRDEFTEWTEKFQAEIRKE